jgi:hypothetical protein
MRMLIKQSKQITHIPNSCPQTQLTIKLCGPTALRTMTSTRLDFVFEIPPGFGPRAGSNRSSLINAVVVTCFTVTTTSKSTQNIRFSAFGFSVYIISFFLIFLSFRLLLPLSIDPTPLPFLSVTEAPFPFPFMS